MGADAVWSGRAGATDPPAADKRAENAYTQGKGELAWDTWPIVWTPDPSGHARKGLGNNLARECLAGMPRFLNPANFIFRSSTRLVRYYSNFQNFYALPYITSCH